MKLRRFFPAIALASAAWIATSAQAQWSTDPANPFQLANGNGDQAQPKIAPTSDGGAYISWFDNTVANYKNDTWTWSGTAWTRTAAAGPAARYRHAMTYDSARQRTVMFGGANASSSFSDTWEWDGAAWAQRNLAGPPGRQGLAMAFDAAHNQVVLFGGMDSSSTLMGDTWTFDGVAWTQQAPASSPTARQGHAMAWDSSRNLVVLFGGADSSGAVADTWEWNGATWTMATPATPPSARQGHAMAFDPVTSKVLMFGGQNGAAMQDTWTYDATGWASITTATLPNARYNCAMANDFTASGVRTVVFGGYSGTFNVGNMYEFSGTNWASKTTTPNARNGPAMAFHAANNTTVLFGGLDVGGYDVYLQRVDASGVEQWPHNGIAIADRAQSSTVDYSLATDQGGNAVIVFNDDRFSTGKITLQKVSSAGQLLFNGSQGLQIADAATNAAPPTVAVLADGNYGVMWMNSTSPVATVLQKVDASTGALMWGASGITQNDWLSPARPVETSDMQSDGAGGVIVLFVRCTGTNCVTSNKQLFAQRYDGNGLPVWNSGVPVTVFAGTSSIQTGNFPRFVSDGAGGAVFGWYENGGSRNSYIQHVLANGNLKFASPVATTGVTAGRIRVLSAFNYNPTTGDYYASFDECDSAAQTNHTTNVQRISNEGSLQWGNDGLLLRGPDGFYATIGNPSVQPLGDGCLVVWNWEDNTGRGYTYAARASNEGTISWNEQIASTYQTYSNKLTSAMSTHGFCIVAMGAGPAGNGDIQASRLNFDGSLGNPVSHCGTADFNCDGDVGTDADIEAFFACLAGTCPSAPCANNADFNADGDIGTDADIEAFFRVLGGGTC